MKRTEPTPPPYGHVVPTVPEWATPVPPQADAHIDAVLAGDDSDLGPDHHVAEIPSHVIERIAKHYERGGFEVEHFPLGDGGAWLPLVHPPKDILESTRCLKHHRTLRCTYGGLTIRMQADGLLLVPKFLERA